MNREDIIRMAREAGLYVEPHGGGNWAVPLVSDLPERVERFAALVAAAERDACAQAANQNYLNGYCVGRTDLLAEQAKAETVEPVAYIHETGFLVRNPAATLTAGMKLYSAPPKRKPMTEQQLDDMFDQAEIAIYLADRQRAEHLEVYSFGVRDAEKWHGIGGEE